MKASLIASLFLPLLALALPKPADISDRAPSGHVIQSRQVCTSRQYCLTGWNQRNYSGTSARLCCYWGQCCSFTNDLLVNHLLSAKASGVAGLYLFTDSGCTADATRVLIDQEGYNDLGKAPAFHSMNMDE